MRQRVEDLGRIYKCAELCFLEESTRANWEKLDKETFRMSWEAVLKHLDEIFEIAEGYDKLNRDDVITLNQT